MKIKSLTGLRFFAALGMFLHHLDAFNDMNIPGHDRVMHVLFELFVGVNFFFILSGFLLAYSYQQKVQAQEVQPKSFVFYRLARLWPMHVLVLLVGTILFKWWPHVTSRPFLAQLFLLQSYVPIPAYSFSFNGVTWSISTEIFFYVAFCFLIVLSSKRLKQLFMVLLAVILFHIMLRGNNWDMATWTFYINPFFRVIDFLAGILLYRFISENPTEISEKKATSMEIASILVLLFFMAFAIVTQLNLVYRFDLYYLIPMLFLIYAFSFDKGAVSKFLAHPAIQFFGETSFAFYLTHQIILLAMKNLFRENITSLKDIAFYSGIALVLVFIASSLLYVFVEKPVYKFLRDWWDKKVLKA